MFLSLRVCKTMFMKKLNKTFIISLQRSLLHGPHLRRALFPSKYLTPSCSKFCNDAASTNTATPKKVSHVEIIAAVIRQSETKASKSMKKKAKDIKEDEIVELLEKAGIKPTQRKIYLAHRRLLLLEKGGCSVEKVKACPSVMTMTNKQLLFGITALKQIDFEVIYPDLIITAIETDARGLKSTADNWICDMFGFRQRRELIQSVFNLTTDEFDHYETKQKYFQKMPSIPKFLKKVHVILKSGFTIEQIKSNLWMLDYSEIELQKRIAFFKCLSPGVKLEPWILQQLKSETINDSAISEKVEKDVEQQNKIDLKLKKEKYIKYKLCESNYEVMSRMLDVDIKHLTKFHKIEKMQRKLLVEKLEFLLEHNIPSNDIVNHIYVLYSRGMKTMLEVVEKTKKAGIQSLSITHFLNLPSSKRFPKFSKKLVFHKELAMLLDIGVYEVQLFGLPDSWQADRIKMQENFDFIIEQGFSIEDIKSCPLLLGHSGNTLQEYLEILKNHKELNLLEDIQNDKHKYLNALQYLIEKDFKFCGVVTPLKKFVS